MEKKRYIWKRIIAYTIDILLITMLVSMLSNIKAINPKIDKYQKEYKEYTEVVEKYQKKKISKKKYQKEYNRMYYNLQKNSIYYNIIYLVLIVLYFGVFQYITHGQTVGKKVMKIQLVTDDGKAVPLTKTILRSIFLYSTIYYILLSTGILILTSSVYSTYAQIIYYLNMILELTIIYLVFKREDSKGLHDIIAKTKVIYLDEVKDEKVIIDAKIEEKKESPKKKTSTKPKKKTTKKSTKGKKIDE